MACLNRNLNDSTFQKSNKEKQTNVYANSDDIWHVIFLSWTNQLQRMIDRISWLQLQLDCAIGNDTQISKCVNFFNQFA